MLRLCVVWLIGAALVAALGCGARAPRSVSASAPAPARAVVQLAVDIDSYVVQTESARFAVFADTVVDLSVRRVSRTDLDGVLGISAPGDQVYRARGAGAVELFELTSGGAKPVASSEAAALLRAAPEQTWSSHQGVISNPALLNLTPTTRAIAASLTSVAPAIVLDIDEHAERLLTANAEHVCLWSMRELARKQCAPRAFQSYALSPDGTLRVWQALPDGTEQVGRLSALDGTAEWLPSGTKALPADRSLQYPCGLELTPGPSENVFTRAGRVLFVLHDFGADGWAIVLPDGRYLAPQPEPRGLAFFERDGRLCSSERVRALYQPDAVREQLRRGRDARCSL
jgi:hypothetical protein